MSVNEHRMAQPSACRYCGVTTNESTRVADFRVCRRCQPIGGDHGRLWAAITGDPTITSAEGYWLTTEGLMTNPAWFARDPETWWATGTRKPWQHLPSGLAGDARTALRRHRDATVVRKHPKGVCAICGVRRDDGWTVPASERGRAVCGTCSTVLGRVGWPAPGTDEHADATTAACLAWPVSIGLGRRIPVTAYATWAPDGDGTDDPWGHVPAADRREARIRLALAGSSSPNLTDEERAEVARRTDEAAMNWAEQVTPRGPIHLGARR